MSSTKDWMMDLEYEDMIEWMRETYGIPEHVEIDEDYPDFDDMVDEYQFKLDAEADEAEIRWFLEHPFLESFSVFGDQLKSLKMGVEAHNELLGDKTYLRMAFAHAVTLFEAMVGDILKTALLKYPHMMRRFVTYVSKDKPQKYTLKEFADLGVNGIVINMLNEQSFHNPITVRRYIEFATGVQLPDADIAKIKKVVDIRHDFVHRNGRTMAGDSHVVDVAFVMESIEVIDEFSALVFDTLSAAKDDVS